MLVKEAERAPDAMTLKEGPWWLAKKDDAFYGKRRHAIFKTNALKTLLERAIKRPRTEKA